MTAIISPTTVLLWGFVGIIVLVVLGFFGVLLKKMFTPNGTPGTNYFASISQKLVELRRFLSANFGALRHSVIFLTFLILMTIVSWYIFPAVTSRLIRSNEYKAMFLICLIAPTFRHWAWGKKPANMIMFITFILAISMYFVRNGLDWNTAIETNTLESSNTPSEPASTSKRADKKVDDNMPTLPEMYGGKDGKGFYIWAPPMQPGKDVWSARVDPNGQRECDKVHWNNVPDTSEPKTAAPDNSNFSPFTNQELVCDPPKYSMPTNRTNKSIPVEFVINEDFLHPHDLPYSGNLQKIYSMRFRSKTDTGVWIHVYWQRIR